MARREKTIKIAAQNRDFGKVYEIHELPVMVVEEWVTKAFLAMLHGGAQIPDEIVKLGLAGLASMKIEDILLAMSSGVNYADVKELMDQMLTAITYKPSPDVSRFYKPGVDDMDIEELSTLITLRREVVTIHTDFFTPADA